MFCLCLKACLLTTLLRKKYRCFILSGQSLPSWTRSIHVTCATIARKMVRPKMPCRTFWVWGYLYQWPTCHLAIMGMKLRLKISLLITHLANMVMKLRLRISPLMTHMANMRKALRLRISLLMTHLTNMRKTLRLRISLLITHQANMEMKLRLRISLLMTHQANMRKMLKLRMSVYDTLDHYILLDKLQYYGINGTALKCLISYKDQSLGDFYL